MSRPNIETLEARREIARQNGPILRAMTAAHRRGDRPEFMRLFTTLNIPADVALHMKRAYGADTVREIGMRTDRAEAMLGPDWLDE